MKTIDEIVCEMLSVADSAEKKHIYDLRELSSDSLRAYANLIKEAHKKELADAVAAKCEVCDQSVTDCNQQKDWRKICAACQEGEYPEDCEYFGEPGGCNAPTMGKHPTCKESLQVGNVAKILKVLKYVLKMLYVDCKGEVHICAGDAEEVIAKIKSALASPPRNCDVYTEAQLYKMATEEMKSELGNVPQGILDIVDIVAREIIRGLFAEAKGEAK